MGSLLAGAILPRVHRAADGMSKLAKNSIFVNLLTDGLFFLFHYATILVKKKRSIFETPMIQASFWMRTRSFSIPSGLIIMIPVKFLRSKQTIRV